MAAGRLRANLQRCDADTYCACLQANMTKILAAPEFAHGKGFFTDAGEVARSVWAVGRRLYPYSVTCEDVQEVRS